jgi:hypothetical protein
VLEEGLKLRVELIVAWLLGDRVQRLVITLVALIFPDVDCPVLARVFGLVD